MKSKTEKEEEKVYGCRIVPDQTDPQVEQFLLETALEYEIYPYSKGNTLIFKTFNLNSYKSFKATIIEGDYNLDLLPL